MSPPYCLILHAAQSAGDQLRSGRHALDVVQSVVTTLEDYPHFNAGKGAVLNNEGHHEKLEAAIAEGFSGAYGAVACVQRVKNPIKAARAVMDHGSSAFVVGPAADLLAEASNLEMVTNDYFTTASRRADWERPVIPAGPIGGVRTNGPRDRSGTLPDRQ
ncbi:MAG: hypothetical protein M1826_006594 [Phylliscum demangeonii]|nr:MAG: hypothetical protein M1826_006594 [Phylliscum demangeonii]